MNPLTLYQNHFQIAYVARDLERAMRRFGDDFGVVRWDVMDMAALHGHETPLRYIGNAYAGDVMVEIIEPVPGAASIYADWLSADDDKAVRLHHLGFLVDSAEKLKATVEQLEKAGFPTAHAGSFGEVLDYHYADARPLLGHYLEFIHLKRDGEAFFARIPRN